MATAKELFQISKEVQQTAEELVKAIKEREENDETSLGLKSFDYIVSIFNSLRTSEPKKEEMVPYNIEERVKTRKKLFKRKKFFQRIKTDVKLTTIKELEDQMRSLVGQAVYEETTKPVDLKLAKRVNREFVEFFSAFGDAETVLSVRFVDRLGKDVAQYDEKRHEIRFLNISFKELKKRIKAENAIGYWRSQTVGDIMWHELGHSYVAYIKATDQNAGLRFRCIEWLVKQYKKLGLWRSSGYGETSLDELIAELFIERRYDTQRKESKYLFQILTDDKFFDIFQEAKNAIV